MSSSKNLEQEKTSFLNKSNSTFIEDMYVRFIEKDPNLPESWKKYFETLDDDTLYFVISALNQLDIDYIRNKILLKVLPLKV